MCDHDWDSNDARVACRQLGFGDNPTHIRAFSPSASGGLAIWLDDVNCTGDESRLIDCGHNGVGIHNCTHSNDAGVICGGSLPSV